MRYLSSFSKQGAPVTDLTRFLALMSRLGNPQNGLRCIHIVGTNGKGSVAEYISAVLTECGYKTGRFTSPFIIDIRERITIDGHFISEESFSRLAGIVRTAAEQCENNAFSQFEILNAVCFLYFAEQAVDYAVIEAGIGGTLDCTNIIPCPEAAVITSIGLDHTAILGTTEAEIARSKSGVIKGSTAIAAAGISEEAMAVIKARCAETGARLVVPDTSKLNVIDSGLNGSSFVYRGEEYRVQMCGEHQIGNALTALETLASLNTLLPADRVKSGIYRAVMPARMERIGRLPSIEHCPEIILDGGHNPQAMRAARAVLSGDSRRKTALIGMINTKDYKTALEILLPCFERVVFCDGFADNAADAEELSKIAGHLGIESAWAHDIKTALIKAFEITEELLFIGGSLYLAAEVRAALLGGMK